MNIVIPMAGRGSRFVEAGFRMPKPLIDLGGVRMIELVVRNIRPVRPHRFIFVCLEEHLQRYALRAELERWAPGCLVLKVSDVTAGAACTVLEAADAIDSAEPLMIANSDQFIDHPIDLYLEQMDRDPGSDGLVMTMTADDPKWSFVERDRTGRVSRIVEKVVVSEEATVGIYNFRHGRDFVRAARAMVAAEERANGEFYVAPVYNRLIAEGSMIGTHGIGSVGAGMHGLGTPADLAEFLASPVAARALRQRSLASA